MLLVRVAGAPGRLTNTERAPAQPVKMPRSVCLKSMLWRSANQKDLTCCKILVSETGLGGEDRLDRVQSRRTVFILRLRRRLLDLSLLPLRKNGLLRVDWCRWEVKANI